MHPCLQRLYEAVGSGAAGVVPPKNAPRSRRRSPAQRPPRPPARPQCRRPGGPRLELAKIIGDMRGAGMHNLSVTVTDDGEACSAHRGGPHRDLQPRRRLPEVHRGETYLANGRQVHRGLGPAYSGGRLSPRLSLGVLRPAARRVAGPFPESRDGDPGRRGPTSTSPIGATTASRSSAPTTMPLRSESSRCRAAPARWPWMSAAPEWPS